MIPPCREQRKDLHSCYNNLPPTPHINSLEIPNIHSYDHIRCMKPYVRKFAWKLLSNIMSYIWGLWFSREGKQKNLKQDEKLREWTYVHCYCYYHYYYYYYHYHHYYYHIILPFFFKIQLLQVRKNGTFHGWEEHCHYVPCALHKATERDGAKGPGTHSSAIIFLWCDVSPCLGWLKAGWFSLLLLSFFLHHWECCDSV